MFDIWELFVYNSLGKNWNHGSIGKRTDTKNHQEHCWCYITLYRFLKDTSLGLHGCFAQKRRHCIHKTAGDSLSIIPQQSAQFEGRALMGCCSHWPAYLDNLLQHTAHAGQYGSPNPVEICMEVHRMHEGWFLTVIGHGSGISDVLIS